MNLKAFPEALLILVKEGISQRNWALHDRTTIGRWDDNDVTIPDRWISRHHAEIQRQGTRYILIDLDSKNGTYLNGQRVTQPVALEDGDEIQVAPRYQLTFVDTEATAPLFQGQDGVQVDERACRVWVKGQELEPSLSSAQFALLLTLSAEPGRVFARHELVAACWPDEDPSGISEEALNSLVRRLRRRLMDVDPSHRYIYAVRGHGFKFEQP
jgi:DNA-binding response OmpR family regulator